MKPAKQASLGKVFGLVAALTFVSKFIGLFRDIFLLSAYGAGLITDAFNYANMFTGNIFVLFGGLGGPFHQSTVAVVTPKKDSPEVGRLIFQLVTVTAVLLTIISGLIWLLKPLAIGYLIQSRGNPELWHKVSTQLDIMLPLIVISGVIGILYGISNVYGEFTWPSLSPALASIAMIVAVIFFRDSAGLCLAYGTLIGALLQLLAQLPATLPHMRWQMSSKPEPGAKEYTHMLWPAAISTSIGTLTVYVDMLFASSIKLGADYNGGAWTAIVNSNRLVQLPLGVLLTAMLVPILPRFSQQVSEDRIDDLKAEFRRGLRLLWFLSLPLAALLMVLPGPIIELLFQRGNFVKKDTALFAIALIWLSPSIIVYVGRDLITRVFYAFKDSKTPYRVAMVAIGLKALLDWLLIGPLGVGGISLASTLITTFNLCLLSYMLRKRIGNLGITLLIKPFSIMIGASALAAGVAYFSYAWLKPVADSLHDPFVAQLGHFLSQAKAAQVAHFALLSGAIGIPSLLALLIYLVVCLVFHLDEPSEVMKRLRRSKAKPTGVAKENPEMPAVDEIPPVDIDATNTGAIADTAGATETKSAADTETTADPELSSVKAIEMKETSEKLDLADRAAEQAVVKDSTKSQPPNISPKGS